MILIDCTQHAVVLNYSLSRHTEYVREIYNNNKKKKKKKKNKNNYKNNNNNNNNNSNNNIYVAVPCRNRKLFRRAFRSHCCIRSTISLNLH